MHTGPISFINIIDLTLVAKGTLGFLSIIPMNITIVTEVSKIANAINGTLMRPLSMRIPLTHPAFDGAVDLLIGSMGKAENVATHRRVHIAGMIRDSE